MSEDNVQTINEEINGQDEKKDAFSSPSFFKNVDPEKYWSKKQRTHGYLAILFGTVFLLTGVVLGEYLFSNPPPPMKNGTEIINARLIDELNKIKELERSAFKGIEVATTEQNKTIAVKDHSKLVDKKNKFIEEQESLEKFLEEYKLLRGLSDTESDFKVFAHWGKRAFWFLVAGWLLKTFATLFINNVREANIVGEKLVMTHALKDLLSTGVMKEAERDYLFKSIFTPTHSTNEKVESFKLPDALDSIIKKKK